MFQDPESHQATNSDKNPNDRNIIPSEEINAELFLQAEPVIGHAHAHTATNEAIQDLEESKKQIQKSGESIIVSPISLPKPNLTNLSMISNNIPLSSISPKPQKNIFPRSVKTILSYTGAHGTQINISPEDMEYNKIIHENTKADFSSIASVTSSVLKYIRNSATTTLQNHFGISQVSSLFVSASSISENENAHVQTTQSPQKEENAKNENSEAPTAELNAQKKFEVIDGTTIYMKADTTAEISHSEHMIESSFAPNPSILPSNIVTNDNTFSATRMSTVSVASHEQNVHLSSDYNSLSTTSLMNDVNEPHLKTAQKMDEKHIISPKIDPSITEEKDGSDLPTPILRQNSLKAENSEPKEAQDTNVENIQPVATSIPGQHVSTENIISSVMSGDNDDDAVEKTVTLKPSSELPTIPSTETPMVSETQSNEIEQKDLSESHIDKTNNKMSHEDVKESTAASKVSSVHEVGNQLNDNSVDLETPHDEIEDIEDQDDDEEIESEELKEERKKVIQQSLEIESKTGLNSEYNVPSSYKENIINESPSTVSENESQTAESISKEDTDSNLVQRDVKADENDLNEEKGLFGSLFGSSNEAKNDELQKEEDSFTDGTAEREANIENGLIQISDNEESEATDNSRNEETFNKRPGDDIKFYEPGDMLPNDNDIRASGDTNTQNENRISDRNIVDTEESEGFTAENNGKIRYSKWYAKCLERDQHILIF